MIQISKNDKTILNSGDIGIVDEVMVKDKKFLVYVAEINKVVEVIRDNIKAVVQYEEIRIA